MAAPYGHCRVDDSTPFRLAALFMCTSDDPENVLIARPQTPRVLIAYLVLHIKLMGERVSMHFDHVRAKGDQSQLSRNFAERGSGARDE